MRKDWLQTVVLERGLLSPEQLDEIEKHPATRDRTLLEKLYRSGLVDEKVLLKLLVEQGAQDATATLEAGLPHTSALGALDRNVASQTRAIPLKVEAPRLVVGMLDPSDTSALERIAFFAGLLVEPRAVRASVLFQALHDAYGVEKVAPDPVAFSGPAAFTGDDDLDDTLPPPSRNLPEVRTTGVPSPEVRANTPAADPSTSPLAAQLVGFAGGEVPDYARNPPGDAPTFGWLRDQGPSTPALTDLPDPAENPIALRDSIPPQVLPILHPTFRTALLFLVRDDVAVGWDGAGDGITTDKVRDVLLPLTAKSAFARAWAWGMVAAGNSKDPTTIERIFFRFLDKEPPAAFVVLPVRVGNKTAALLYVDLEQGILEESRLEVARQVGTAIADAIAPLVADETLFGPSPPATAEG